MGVAVGVSVGAGVGVGLGMRVTVGVGMAVGVGVGSGPRHAASRNVLTTRKRAQDRTFRMSRIIPLSPHLRNSAPVRGVGSGKLGVRTQSKGEWASS